MLRALVTVDHPARCRSPRLCSPRATTLCALASLAPVVACDRGASSPPRPPITPAAASAPAPQRDAATAAAPAVAASSDASAAAAAVVDAGPSFTPPTQIVALGTWVPIRQNPRRDAPLVGYLRAGGIARVEGMPAGRETCPVRRDHPEGGWYRLAGGGYVCVGGALAEPWPSRGMRRPVQPDTDGGTGMPYQYAIVYGRANMYRAPPSLDELRVYEPWRFRRDDPDASAAAAGAQAATGSEATASSGEETPAATAPPPPAPPPAPAANTAARDRDRDRDRHNDRDRDRRHASTDTPSETATTTPDGEPRLRDLRGDRSGPVIRRLLTGMYVALDRTVTSRETGDQYWHTQSGGYVRTGPLSVAHRISTFQGAVLAEGQGLPHAFMVSNTGYTYRVSASGRSVSTHRSVPRLTSIPLAANEPPLELNGQRYWRTADGLAVNARNVRVAQTRTPPEGLTPNEKWIDIDLDQQILVAYEGTRPVFVTLVSTGRRSDSDPERNYETPAGSFRIRGKHISTTMDGDTAADGPYSIEDVPWAMYFFESYALHGAFWHGNYGWRMSHGCVNLSPLDARWLFFWSEPALPEGWHGVFGNEQRPGTRVELHHGSAPTPRVPVRHG